MQLKILYEDKDILLVHKEAGFPTQTGKIGQMDVVSEAKNYLITKEKGHNSYVALINRLDQPVEGIVLMAKNEQAAKLLSEQLQKNKMEKKYYALILGKPKKKSEILKEYLVKEKQTNLSRIAKSVTESGAKYAELSYHVAHSVYKTIKNEENCGQVSLSILTIQLKTGRHHQIRVQMANAGCPLLGDSKYGSEKSMELSKLIGIKNVALCAYSLTFVHPKTKKAMEIKIEMPQYMQDTVK